MVFYRIYQLRGPRNEVESFHEFEAENDDAAIAVAEGVRRENAMELWSDHRKIQRWEILNFAPASSHETQV
jgi:hypothetical protein